MDVKLAGRTLKAVLFDLDDTLHDDDGAFRLAVPRVCEVLRAKYQAIEPAKLAANNFAVADVVWTRLTGVGMKDGHAIRVQTWREALADTGLDAGRFGLSLTVEDLAEVAAALYREERRATYRAYPDVAPVLEALKGKVRMGVVTNGAPDTQRDKIKALGIGGYFDAVLSSGEVGVPKPDPKIFETMLRRLGVEPSEAAHVGDSLVNDVAGARNAGIGAIWLNRKGMKRPADAAVPDWEITSLAELTAPPA